MGNRMRSAIVAAQSLGGARLLTSWLAWTLAPPSSKEAGLIKSATDGQSESLGMRQFCGLWLSPCDARKTGRNLSKPFAEVPAKSNTAALPHYLFLILFLGMAFFTNLAVFR